MRHPFEVQDKSAISSEYPHYWDITDLLAARRREINEWLTSLDADHAWMVKSLMDERWSSGYAAGVDDTECYEPHTGSMSLDDLRDYNDRREG